MGAPQGGYTTIPGAGIGAFSRGGFATRGLRKSKAPDEEPEEPETPAEDDTEDDE